MTDEPNPDILPLWGDAARRWADATATYAEASSRWAELTRELVERLPPDAPELDELRDLAVQLEQWAGNARATR